VRAKIARMRQSFLGARLTLACALGGALAGCSEDEQTPGPGGRSDAGDAEGPDAGAPFVCDVVAPSACPNPAPTFADVQPIFHDSCGVCHGKDWTGAWPLDTYSHIADWSDVIRDELVSCSMPPADGGVMIASEERMKILSWIRCGTPR
jgi:hypothetical protein